MKDYIVKELINQIPADQELTYRERIAVLRRRKLEQTGRKIAAGGGADEDDYGSIVPPESFQWQPIPNHPDGSFYGYQGWADNFYDLMSRHPLYVDPLDAFTGKWLICLSRVKGSRWLPENDYSHLKPFFAKYNILCGIGDDAHFAPDYQIGLELGWGGLLTKLDHYQKMHGPEKAPFYAAERKAIQGVQIWIRRTIELLSELEGMEQNRLLKANLREMRAVNEWIIAQPPRTLREACQWLCWFNMATRTYNRDGAGGQLDELLRPYYTRDIAAGTIDDEAALFYIACLLLNETHYYQLGGPGPDGRDVTSRVSHLILEAADLINSSCNLTVRVHDGLDEGFFRKSVAYLFKNKNGWPRYSGDKALLAGFMQCGFPAELARRRIAVGCNWMSLPGLEYTMNDLVKINTAKVFEVAYQEMTGTQKSPSVAGLWRRFAAHLRRAVAVTAAGQDFHLKHQTDNEPELLLNLLSHGPVEKGIDMAGGGASYYNLAIDGAGIAVVADSFAALEQRIEKEARLTWAELNGHLAADYAGSAGEYVRLMMKSSERYGEGNSRGDAWGQRISRLFTNLVREQNQHYPYNFIPGWFSWANTISFGKTVGATPNGRRAGEPINHGANPLPGFRRDGAVTALANTVAAVQPVYGNTAPVQLEFDPHLAATEESIAKIAAFIRGIFDNGATLLNINIIDGEKILAAHRDPSQFPDLVVRVTGFTAYFAMLSPEFRQLVVDRIIAC